MDSGTEWSDVSCALIHGPVTGVRIWQGPANGYIKLWVSISGFLCWNWLDIQCGILFFSDFSASTQINHQPVSNKLIVSDEQISQSL